MAKEPQVMATEVQPLRHGWGLLPCPRCGEKATISINLANLTEEDACKCNECEGEFGVDNIRYLLLQWTPVIQWISQAPELK